MSYFMYYYSITDLWSYYLPFLYSCISFLGVLILLVCTPLGFVQLFDVVSRVLIKPKFFHDINDEFYASAMEEETQRRRLDRILTVGKDFHPPPMMDVHLNFGLRHRNGLETEYRENLAKQSRDKEILERRRNTSYFVRNILHPVAMILLITLTMFAVLLVLQNTISLLIGIKALPSSSKQFTLGVSSLSKLGPFGAFLEIVLILYLIATSGIGLYTAPGVRGMRPQKDNTPFYLIIGNCAVILVSSSALPLLSKILGITNFDLLGDFGSIEWLGNFQIVLMYNLLFALGATFCVLNKFTAKVRRELYARLTQIIIIAHQPYTAWFFPLFILACFLFMYCATFWCVYVGPEFVLVLKSVPNTRQDH